MWLLLELLLHFQIYTQLASFHGPPIKLLTPNHLTIPVRCLQHSHQFLSKLSDLSITGTVLHSSSSHGEEGFLSLCSAQLGSTTLPGLPECRVVMIDDRPVHAVVQGYPALLLVGHLQPSVAPAPIRHLHQPIKAFRITTNLEPGVLEQNCA